MTAFSLRFAIVAAALMIPSALLASPSTFDATWGNAGQVALPSGRSVTRIDALPDGAIIAVAANEPRLPSDSGPKKGFIFRVLADGSIDKNFANGGFAFDCSEFATCSTRTATDAQGRVWLVARQDDTDGDIVVRRLLPSGAPDASFGVNGLLRTRTADWCIWSGCPFSLNRVLSIATLPSGRALLAVECVITPPNPLYGTCFVSVSSAGAVEWIRPVSGYSFGIVQPYAAIPSLPEGSAMFAGLVPLADGYSKFALLKLLANGEPDSTFGISGIATPSAPYPVADQIAPTMDGGALVLFPTKSILRVTRDGLPDPSLGVGGVVNAPEFSASALTAMPDSSVLAVGTLAGQVAIMRLRPDGSRDSRFGGQGIIAFNFMGGSGGQGIVVKSNGRITMGGYTNVGIETMQCGHSTIPCIAPVRAPLLFQVEGGSDTFDRFWLETTAVEYFHPQFGHYFVTANGAEEYGLDTAANPAWVRTGKQFKVWIQSAPELAEVCRFWSGQSFAPKSSHFYTPYVSECQGLAGGGVWGYEGTAFYLRLPEGAPGARTCPAGAQPLYRAYNNGQGGAPNHRYTTDLATIDAMVAQGWIVEGDAGTRLFACAPIAN